jgi:hypothetical protein
MKWIFSVVQGPKNNALCSLSNWARPSDSFSSKFFISWRFCSDWGYPHCRATWTWRQDHQGKSIHDGRHCCIKDSKSEYLLRWTISPIGYLPGECKSKFSVPLARIQMYEHRPRRGRLCAAFIRANVGRWHHWSTKHERSFIAMFRRFCIYPGSQTIYSAKTAGKFSTNL